MNSQLKAITSAPGEATIIVVGQSEHYGDILTISFPQFASISSQKVLEQTVDGKDLLLTIDADSLGDILEPGSPYQLKIPELNCIGTVIWPEIIGKRAESKGVIHTGSTLSEKPSLSTELKEEIGEKKEEIHENADIVSEPDIEEGISLIQDEPKRSSSLPLILSIVIIFLMIIAGGAYWYIKSHQYSHEVKKEQIVKKEEPKKEVAKPTETVKNNPTSPPKAEARPEQSFAETLQKMSVTDVINKAPNTAIITKEGERRLEVKQFDDGVLLLENAASKGDAEAMLKLGLLYSPVDFKEGGAIPSPDMREAAKYLQNAEQNGLKDAVTPRAALKEWLTKKAGEGDDLARLTLKDFWK